jgi:predicted membrane protein
MDPQNYKSEFEQRLHDKIHNEIHDRIRQKINRRGMAFPGDGHSGFAWGLTIVLVGVAWLLYDMGIVPFNPVVRFWPVLLILFGLMKVVTRSERSFGFVLIVAGTFLQLNKLGYTHLSFADLWPIALIAVGFLLMWGSLEARGFIRAKRRIFENLREQVAGKPDAPPGMLNAAAIFGGCERRISAKNFQGGKVTAVFGGVELDFREADIDTENGEAILEINCVLGGVEMRVPQNWQVHSRTVPVLGGYEDTSRQAVNPTDAKPKTLVITGMVVLGGVEIRN